MLANGITSSDANNLLFDLWQIPRVKSNNKPKFKKREVVPFPTPSSLMRTDLLKLKSRDYLVSVKNDGIRSILIFGSFRTQASNIHFENMALFIQRNGVVSHSNYTTDDTEIYCGTAFDGELLKDGSFIVFDMVSAYGYSYTSQELPKRLIAARNTVAKLIPNSATNLITVKEFFNKHDSRHLFDALSEGSLLSLQVDGLILAPTVAGVGIGRLINYYKYKESNQITVDLSWCQNDRLLRCGPPGNELIEDAIRNVLWNEDDFKLFDNGVYECTLTKKTNELTLYPKIKRNDKTTANSKYVILRTVQNVIENIQPLEVWEALTCLG